MIYRTRKTRIYLKLFDFNNGLVPIRKQPYVAHLVQTHRAIDSTLKGLSEQRY